MHTLIRVGLSWVLQNNFSRYRRSLISTNKFCWRSFFLFSFHFIHYDLAFLSTEQYRLKSIVFVLFKKKKKYYLKAFASFEDMFCRHCISLGSGDSGDMIWVIVMLEDLSMAYLQCSCRGKQIFIRVFLHGCVHWTFQESDVSRPFISGKSQHACGEEDSVSYFAYCTSERHEFTFWRVIRTLRTFMSVWHNYLSSSFRMQRGPCHASAFFSFQRYYYCVSKIRDLFRTRIHFECYLTPRGSRILL